MKEKFSLEKEHETPDWKNYNNQAYENVSRHQRGPFNNLLKPIQHNCTIVWSGLSRTSLHYGIEGV